MAGPQDSRNYVGYRIANGLAPRNLPKALTVDLDFSLQASYHINLELATERDRIDFVQSIFIDNSQNAQPLTITFWVSRQTVVCPPNAQGYFPVYVPEAPKMDISLPATVANTDTRIQFLNVPMPACVWGVGAASGSLTGNFGNNADSLVPIAAGLVGDESFIMGYNSATNQWDRLKQGALSGDTQSGAFATGNLNVRSFALEFNGSTWDRRRTPNVFKTLSTVAIGAEATIWTPAAGKKFRLMGFQFGEGVATGAIALKDNTAGTTIYIVPANTVGAVVNSPNMGNGILSNAANNVLTATGVATETLTGMVFGTEE